MMEEDFPVEPASREESTVWSTASRMAGDISENLLGVGSPDMFADVDTSGRPSLETSC